MGHDYMSWANYVMNHELTPAVKLQSSFQEKAALSSPSVQVFLPQEKLPVEESTLQEARVATLEPIVHRIG